MTKNFIGHGQYSRSLIVETEQAICFECKQTKKVLAFDNSDNEYSTMRFCIECLNKFAEGHISESSWDDDYTELGR